MAVMKSFRHKETGQIAEMPEHIAGMFNDVLECVEPCDQTCESCKIEVEEEEGNRG